MATPTLPVSYQLLHHTMSNRTTPAHTATPTLPVSYQLPHHTMSNRTTPAHTATPASPLPLRLTNIHNHYTYTYHTSSHIIHFSWTSWSLRQRHHKPSNCQEQLTHHHSVTSWKTGIHDWSLGDIRDIKQLRFIQKAEPSHLGMIHSLLSCVHHHVLCSGGGHIQGKLYEWYSTTSQCCNSDICVHTVSFRCMTGVKPCLNARLTERQCVHKTNTLLTI
jgi:hypothetical protein